MAGEAPYADRRRETRVKRATLNPSWEEEFKFTMNDVEDAGEILIAVFDRDPKSTTRGDIDPEKVRQRILRSLEHAERFSMHETSRGKGAGGATRTRGRRRCARDWRGRGRTISRVARRRSRPCRLAS